MPREFTGVYEKNPDAIDAIFDEYGNSYLAVREIRWKSDKEFKLDLRKYRTTGDGDDIVGKGFTFLSEEGPGELATVLLEHGYGDSKEIAKRLVDSRPVLCNEILDLTNGEKLDTTNSVENQYEEDLYDIKGDDSYYS